MILVKDK